MTLPYNGISKQNDKLKFATQMTAKSPSFFYFIRFSSVAEERVVK